MWQASAAPTMGESALSIASGTPLAFKQYTRRWVLLFVISLLQVTNSMVRRPLPMQCRTCNDMLRD